MKKRKNAKFQIALNIVRSRFSQVTSVQDAKYTIEIEVTQQDSINSIAKDHAKCAYAVACKRRLNADGFMVSKRTAYCIIGKKAFRYRVPESVTREIVSFDRRAGFAPGIYQLKAPSKYEQLGMQGTGKTHNPSNRKKPRFMHYTTGIRTSLGSLPHIS